MRGWSFNFTHRRTHTHSNTHPPPLPPLPSPCRYLSAKGPTFVDYMQFSDEVESIFTHKNLEKTPTAEVQQFVPPVEVDLNILSPEEEQILQKTMHRLAERVKRESGRRKKSTCYMHVSLVIRV